MRTSAIAALAGSFALVVACGSSHPLAAGGGTSNGAGGGASDGGFDSEETKPPGCGTAADGTSCGCVDVPLFVDPPNMYFVLDRSGSMADDGKWQQVRVTVGNLTRQVGQRANFGATVFPGATGADQCSAGTEVMALRAGDPPSSDKNGPTTTALFAATNTPPGGGTPTAATLRDVLARVKSFSGKTFVILATDGGPNCNAQTTCTAASCIPNIEGSAECPTGGPFNCCEGANTDQCLDGAPTTTAVKALANSGYPVYVVGIPGSAPYAALLDDLAVAGGTALASSPKYYRVDTASSASLLGTLRKVAAKIVATCTFTFKETPPNPDLVNVYLDEVVLPRDPINGWTISGSTVTLVGNACAKVTNGDVLDVRIIAGCPSVLN